MLLIVLFSLFPVFRIRSPMTLIEMLIKQASEVDLPFVKEVEHPDSSDAELKHLDHLSNF